MIDPNTGYPKKRGTLRLVAGAVGESLSRGTRRIAGAIEPNAIKILKLRERVRELKQQGRNTSAIESQIANLEKKPGIIKSVLEKRKELQMKENAVRTQLRNALIVLDSAKNTNENISTKRKAYANALQAYRNMRLEGGRTGENKYNSTGARRSITSVPTGVIKSHLQFLKNMASKGKSNNALINLNRRLKDATADQALILIGNYGRYFTSNKKYQNALLTREALYKSKQQKNKNKNKNKNRTMGGVPGQQIIFGGGMPSRGGETSLMPGPSAAPFIMPAPAPAAAPFIMQAPTHAAAPSISVKVNVPPAAVQSLPPTERSALNNVGGYRRAASYIQEAGGPETLSKALNALNKTGGNIERAMKTTGLPRQTFTNVNKLGGPVTARRALVAVKKVSKKATRPVVAQKKSLRRPIVASKKGRRRVATVAPKKKEKRVVSACKVCKRPPVNKLKTIVHQLPRKNLERNVLACLLP